MGPHTALPHGEAHCSLLTGEQLGATVGASRRETSWEREAAGGTLPLLDSSHHISGRLGAPMSQGCLSGPTTPWVSIHPRRPLPQGSEGRAGTYLPAGQQSWCLCPAGTQGLQMPSCAGVITREGGGNEQEGLWAVPHDFAHKGHPNLFDSRLRKAAPKPPWLPGACLQHPWAPATQGLAGPCRFCAGSLSSHVASCPPSSHPGPAPLLVPPSASAASCSPGALPCCPTCEVLGSRSSPPSSQLCGEVGTNPILRIRGREAQGHYVAATSSVHTLQPLPHLHDGTGCAVLVELLSSEDRNCIKFTFVVPTLST